MTSPENNIPSYLDRDRADRPVDQADLGSPVILDQGITNPANIETIAIPKGDRGHNISHSGLKPIGHLEHPDSGTMMDVVAFIDLGGDCSVALLDAGQTSEDSGFGGDPGRYKLASVVENGEGRVIDSGTLTDILDPVTGISLGRDNMPGDLDNAAETTSRRHAAISISDSGLRIVDSGSTNGTQVEYAKIGAEPYTYGEKLNVEGVAPDVGHVALEDGVVMLTVGESQEDSPAQQEFEDISVMRSDGTVENGWFVVNEFVGEDGRPKLKVVHEDEHGRPWTKTVDKGRSNYLQNRIAELDAEKSNASSARVAAERGANGESGQPVERPAYLNPAVREMQEAAAGELRAQEAEALYVQQEKPVDRLSTPEGREVRATEIKEALGEKMTHNLWRYASAVLRREEAQRNDRGQESINESRNIAEAARALSSEANLLADDYVRLMRLDNR